MSVSRLFSAVSAVGWFAADLWLAWTESLVDATDWSRQ